MNIGVLGTGAVGHAIATALVQAGHAVCMGSRTADNPQATAWARATRASHGTFGTAARFGEILFNCTAGTASLEVLEQAGAAELDGRILVDVANPLDFSRGMPPTLSVCNTDSLGEQIQRAFPRLRVVKALNTMNCQIMVDPARVPGAHHVFVSGDDLAAKAQVAALLTAAFRWPPERIVDLGDISTARGTEMMLPLWVRLWAALGTANFNFQLAGAPARPPLVVRRPTTVPPPSA